MAGPAHNIRSKIKSHLCDTVAPSPCARMYPQMHMYAPAPCLLVPRHAPLPSGSRAVPTARELVPLPQPGTSSRRAGPPWSSRGWQAQGRARDLVSGRRAPRAGPPVVQPRMAGPALRDRGPAPNWEPGKTTSSRTWTGARGRRSRRTRSAHPCRRRARQTRRRARRSRGVTGTLRFLKAIRVPTPEPFVGARSRTLFVRAVYGSGITTRLRECRETPPRSPMASLLQSKTGVRAAAEGRPVA